MFELFIASLNNWNITKTERQKLQHTYIVLAVVIVLVSGIITLFSANLGHNVVKLALFAIAVFFANAIVWNLLSSSLLDKLTVKTKRK